jgi:hypothetical protein
VAGGLNFDRIRVGDSTACGLASGGRFGATAGANGGVTVPFQIAMQSHLAIGPVGPSRRARALLGQGGVAGEPADFAARLAQILPNPIPGILGYRDSLQFTADQVARLQAISDSLDAATPALSASLQAAIRGAGERPDRSALYARLRPRLAEGRHHRHRALDEARSTLTPDQWARLPDALKTLTPR